MINFTVTHRTTPAMLRAIRAACNELLGESHADLTTQAAGHVTRANELQAAADAEAHKAAAALSAHNAALAEERKLQPLSDTCETLEEAAAEFRAEQAAIELDSAGHAWNAELHASTKAKNQDGTWKKRRGATVMTADGKPSPEQVEKVIERFEAQQAAAATSVPPLPPAVPTAEPIMPKIFALITSQIVTINQAVEAAQAEGFADLGANGLGGAPREAQEAVLRKLEGA